MAILLNVRLPEMSGLHCLEVVDHQLRSILPMEKVAANAVQSIDLKGDWVSQGGVDLQINGVLGLAFPDLEEPEELAKTASFLWNQGIDAFTPTIVTADSGKIQKSLSVIRAYQAQDKRPNHAVVLGAHLEGPFLNPAKRGAHAEEHVQPLSLKRLQSLLADYLDVVKIITLAPEMEIDEDIAVIPWLRSHDITISLGHSLATATEAQTAFAQGASMVTHAFNAMPGLHHREPGLLGAALTQPNVFTGVIADGQHVCPTMLDLLLRTGRGGDTPGGLFLVSDALSPLGLPDGTYPWDSREIEVRQGTARLPDGTLSGTTRPLLDGVKNLVRWGLCSVEEAIALATERPRQAVDMPQLKPRQTTHLLRWHYDGTDLTWQRIMAN
ncbi:MAG: N-acetylglucosamine-6-phosphate deacetylase [Cyanobacteria bacterium P01_D01_bin.56]